MVLQIPVMESKQKTIMLITNFTIRLMKHTSQKRSLLSLCSA